MDRIDKNGYGVVFVISGGGVFYGLVTDGDVRRALVRGIFIDDAVDTIANTQAITLLKEQLRNVANIIPTEKVPEFPAYSSLKVPILDRRKRIIDILLVSKVNSQLRTLCYSAQFKKLLRRADIKRVLIIGGAGYLGSVLCRRLLKEGYSVKVLDNLTYTDEGIRDLIDRKRIELQQGDIRHIDQALRAIQDVDAVIHLAALVGDPASAISAEQTLAINFHSTEMLTSLAKYYRIRKFIFASTCSVYGASGEHLVAETSPVLPVSLYARTKIQSERALLAAKDEYFSPVILRMATIYGLSPRMRFDLVVNLLTAKGYFEHQIPIFGGDQCRPFIHVQDAAAAYVACLKTPSEKVGGEIINIGSNDQNYRILDVGALIKKEVPRAILKIHKEADDNRNYIVDFSKAQRVLKFFPKYNLEQGVKEMVEAMKKGKFQDYLQSKYSNYNSLKNIL